MDLYNYKVLPADICDYLINLYESDVENHERVDNQSKPINITLGETQN